MFFGNTCGCGCGENNNYNGLGCGFNWLVDLIWIIIILNIIQQLFCNGLLDR